MWKAIGLWAVLLLLTGPAWGREFKPVHVFQNAATADGNGTPLPVPGWATIGLQVVITNTATVNFEATVDDSNWVALACPLSSTGTAAAAATESGLYQCTVSGFAQFRARISDCSSCTVTVKGLTTQVSLRSGTSSGGVSTLDGAFDGGKEIDGANSLANAVKIGDGTTPICLYTDATDGPMVRPCTASNITTRILNGFTWALHDEEADAAIETVDPDAASTLAMWTYGAAYRPKKSIWLDAGAASVDAAQCAAPTESSNTVVKTWTIVCADNDAGAIYWKVTMPDSWDGGTVTFEWVIHQVGASTNGVEMDFAAMCYSHDEAASAFASPPTGEQAAAITLTADNDILHGTTAAVTVAGTTCAGGDTLFVTGQVDATASHADIATAVETLGVKMEYSVTSRSD